MSNNLYDTVSFLMPLKINFDKTDYVKSYLFYEVTNKIVSLFEH